MFMSIFTKEMSIEVLKKSCGILSIPNGITELDGDFAFLYDMESNGNNFHFRNIIIPATVEKINGIFLTEYSPDETPVKKFKAIHVHEDNPHFCSVDGVLFSKDMTRLIRYPCGKKEEEYIVPETVVIIENSAFDCNVYLKSIVLPKSLKRIESFAFGRCNSLVNINLPKGLEYIGDECFYCSNTIHRLVIPETVPFIYSSIIDNCAVLEIPDTLTEIKYDYVPTEFLNMPYIGPAILTSNNPVVVEFAETYDYNHFEGYFEDENGIIWSSDKKTLISFPIFWDHDIYNVPFETKYIYRKAFKCNQTVKRVVAETKITVVGKDCDDNQYKFKEPLSGNDFKVLIGELWKNKEKDKIENMRPEHTAKYVFISYSSKNQDIADSTRRLLKSCNISCWMAPYDIPAGSKYAHVINDAIEHSSCLLLLLTNDSQNSQFVEREVERAITYRKPIITMQLEDVILNSGFKFYLGEEQIVAVRDIDQNNPEMLKIIQGLKAFVE